MGANDINFASLLQHQKSEGHKVYSTCSKIFNTVSFLFSNKMLVFRPGIYIMLVRIENREDPDQTAPSVCDVFLGIFGRQHAFEILENLP